MEDYVKQNKCAWEFYAYDFWCKKETPHERAKLNLQDPIKQLKKYADYFDKFEGVRVANICGSCGKKAVPLAVLGAEVTVFDISEANKKYTLEVAESSKVKIDYQVCNVLEIDMNTYAESFDIVFMEGGILHYFHDINEFMNVMYSLLKAGGKMICSDFHPYTKIMELSVAKPRSKDYFSTEVFEGEVAYARFFDEGLREQIPLCSYRKYTISEIINSVIKSGFVLKRFDEHPFWNDRKVPGEFTLVAVKA